VRRSAILFALLAVFVDFFGNTQMTRNATDRLGRSGDPKIFVLERELREVHLLLDNISSNTEKSLALGLDDQVKLGRDWLRRVCEIDWPPEGGTREEAAAADLLIRVKDHLNTLAKPASGLTIAFTHLVTKESGAAAKDGPSRGSLAAGAYPDLVPKARTFRRWMGYICVFLFGWLVLTCFVSWYVAFGNALLTQRAVAQAALADAQKLVDDRLSGGTIDTSGDTTGRAPPAKGPPPRSAPGTASNVQPPLDCEDKQAKPPRLTLPQRQACDARAAAAESLVVADGHIANWLHWSRKQSGSTELSTYAVVLAGLLGTAVLPVLYGILGAGAAILRNLSRKMKFSLLAPRDLNLAFQQLALGAVTGACIGIFVAQPSGSGAVDAAKVIGPAALSGSALSFLAGFGVEAVFGTLEAVIARIFNPQPAGAGASGVRP
jgi:hypothetical protein